MSDTPRCDALAAAQLAELDRPLRVVDHKIELWNLARQLERDLTVAKGLEQMAYDQRDKAFDKLNAAQSAVALSDEAEAVIKELREQQFAGPLAIRAERVIRALSAPSATVPIITSDNLSAPLPVVVMDAIKNGPDGDERLNDEWKRRELFATRIARLAYAAGIDRSWRDMPTDKLHALYAEMTLELHHRESSAATDRSSAK